MSTYTPVAETNHYIVLDDYRAQPLAAEEAAVYQTEADLEQELLRDLQAQGYEYLPHLNSPEALLANLRTQLQVLNRVSFTDAEWQRLLEEYLDCPHESVTDKTRKVQDNAVYDFVFDDGHLQNISLFDKKLWARNKVQVIHQLAQSDVARNRYDVTILVNGLPLVQVELKKRGVAIREAFAQVHRYSKESFNGEHSLFKYIQLFVISNGTDTRYFANTVARDKQYFDFTMRWALSNNTPIRDLKDFTATFFQRQTLLQVVLTYAVFDTNDTLLVMRPYQIAATERLLWKIKSAHAARCWSCPESGGYIWHTTGSGKTLTSFKAARLATELDFIDKVLFVVDRKDLDYQTMKEYQRFSPDSVNGSDSTQGLKANLEKHDQRIVVTTLQKLNNLLKAEADLPIYHGEVVLIFDEAHRSQFGEAQRNVRRRFRKYYQFGFTGTPIFPENANGLETTESVFGKQLHTYVITDAIRDEKVLKFKVDYNDVRPHFRQQEAASEDEERTKAAWRTALLCEERITSIARHILRTFPEKTHRSLKGQAGFNALLAVSSIEAAKRYYKTLHALQADSPAPLRIATIFSYAPNEEQRVAGDLPDESFDPLSLDQTDKEFLRAVVADYNAAFGSNFAVDSGGFQNYYRDVSRRMKAGDIDLLIVVGMFLTGFDAPRLNTLYVDKPLRYHGLMQAFSRTNRIWNATKPFGNIVTFRNLEAETVEALRTFGESNKTSVLLERNFEAYMDGFEDLLTGQYRRGYRKIVADLQTQFPEGKAPETEAERKAFVQLFGEYLRVENILQNFDEYVALKAWQQVEADDAQAVADFCETHYLQAEALPEWLDSTVLPVRQEQDYRSFYNDIRAARRAEQPLTVEPEVDWSGVTFEVELLKSQEINLDYILDLLFHQQQTKQRTKADLKAEVLRLVRSSAAQRGKEALLMDFIEAPDFGEWPDKAGLLDAFYAFAQAQMRQEAAALMAEEHLNEEAARRYIEQGLREQRVMYEGMGLHEMLPKRSPLHPDYLPTKKRVYQKVVDFVEKYKGVSHTL